MTTMIPAPDHTITVAIGDPDRATLDTMVSEVIDALRATVGVVGGTVETHYGNGTWKGEPEHSAHVTTYPAFGTAHAMRALADRLAVVAADHGQESIAVWGSPAIMVTGEAFDLDDDDDDTLGPCGCTDYHMADCPTRG